jgi:plasmid replication initiation protein
MASEPPLRPDAWSARHDRRVDAEQDTRWYAVRSVFQTPGETDHAYEERITLWQASTSDEALSRAEAEAEEYAEFADVVHLSGFAQVYPLADAPPRDGTEVFSLVRDSALPSNAYVDRFFVTGQERQQ